MRASDSVLNNSPSSSFYSTFYTKETSLRDWKEGLYCCHNNFNTDKVCNSANAPLMGFVHMYMHCYLVTRDIFITSRSTRSLRWKLCSKTCFDAVGESRLDQEIQSELRLVF